MISKDKQGKDLLMKYPIEVLTTETINEIVSSSNRRS